MENKSGDSKNKMAEVAALYELELEEEFEIAGYCFNPYRFTDEGLMNRDELLNSMLLRAVLTGDEAIIEKPWEPKDGDIYWCVIANGETSHHCFNSLSSFDQAMRCSGNCFRSEQKAEANKDPIMKKFGWK